MKKPTDAIYNLTNSQQQLDMEGTVVGVYRQALEEVLQYIKFMDQAEWYYYGDQTDSESCRWSYDECIYDDFEYDNEAKGTHVLEISRAAPLPTRYLALRYYTEEEINSRDDDERYTYTVHDTHEEAEQSLS